MDDVADHARARWNDLVRTVISLGADVGTAERTATTALERTWRSWRRERREGDVDVLVYGALLRAWRATGGDVGPEAARVLTTGARLSAYQAELVLGDAVDDDWSAALLGTEWDDLYRGTAPIGAVEQAVSRRRRRTVLLGVGTVVVLLAAGGIGYAVRGDDPPAPPAPRPGPEIVDNAIPLAWWADGTLHLAGRTVDVRGLRSLAQTGPGSGSDGSTSGASYAVVYGDRAGDVHQVDADGTVTDLGHQTPGATLVGSIGGDDTLAAWVDPGDGDDPRLVVWDTAAHELAGALALDDDRYTPVALDGRDVYLARGSVAERWTLGDDGLVDAGRGLLDVAAGADLRRPADQTGPPSAPEPTTDHAVLSPDGRTVAQWRPGRPGVQLPPAPGTASATVNLDLSTEELVDDARFAADGTLVVVAVRYYQLSIGSARNESGGGGRIAESDLFTCDPVTGACEREAGRVTAGGANAPLVLAR